MHTRGQSGLLPQRELAHTVPCLRRGAVNLSRRDTRGNTRTLAYAAVHEGSLTVTRRCQSR